MKIASIIVCSVALCLMYVNTAQSFALSKKLVAAKEPLFAAKAQLANDVKVKIVEVANQAYSLKKKVAVGIATPFVAIQDWKKSLFAKKMAKIAGPIIALRNLKRSIINKKLNTLAKIIPAAAGFGLGGLSQTPEGYEFTQWNGTPFQLNDANNFVLVPEEYTNYHVEDSAAARTYGPGDFIRSTLNGAQSTLETIGNHVPFLNTLTNGVSSFKQSLHPKPVYQFVPNLGFHQYSNIHYEPSVPVSVPTVPEITSTYVQKPYAPSVPELPEVPVIPEIPHIEYGVPTTSPAPPTPEYGPSPPQVYGPPKTGTTFNLPATSASQSFRIPSTSFGVPQGPSYKYTQRF